jgi:TetR/AcrR family transcriptional regulator, regulator of cefoperazone and chloramphenicol sensitivity
VQEDETRVKLLAAAGEVFGEAGFQSATVRDICARAGVNGAAVNYHFRDKLGLYTEALKAAVFDGEFPGKLSNLDFAKPEAALRTFICGMFRQMYLSGQPSWHARLMAHELAHPTPGLSAVVEHVIRPRAKLLCNIVGRIIDRDPLDSHTRLCANSIISQVIHYMHARPVISLLWPDWQFNPAAMEIVAAHVTDFSLAALKGMKLKLAKETRPR